MVLRAVIFDLDQTLIDTLPRFYRVFKSLLNERGRDISWEDFLRDYAEDTLDKYIPPGEDRKSFWNEFLERYSDENCPDDKVIDGAREVLAKLKDMGVKIAVTTGRLTTVDKVEKELERFGLKEYVDLVWASNKKYEDEEELFSKERVLRDILKKLSVKPEECVVVGDYYPDVKSAKSLGAYAIGVLTGHMKEEQLREAGADEVIESVKDLFKAVERIFPSKAFRELSR